MIRSRGLLHARRLFVASLGPGTVCMAATYLSRSTPIRLDSIATSPAAVEPRQQQRAGLSTKTIQQISSGSITGFGVGLLVALFSRTLVLLGSILAVSAYVTSRYGIDLPQLLGVKKLLLKSSLWRKLGGSPWFTASFALTFTLAAFVRL